MIRYELRALALFLLIPVIATSQLTISSADMPKPGDTVRYSITFETGGIDYQQTGPDVTWDFSGLPVMLQRVDTFVSVGETPLAYQFVFNNGFLFPEHEATVAQEVFEFDLVPGFEVDDVFFFYKETTEDYREVGLGVGLNGITIPVDYDEIDVIYRFPVSYGDVDSSQSSFLKSLPGLGTASSEKSRKNYVDGYGTLITPYGTFETLKIRTDIYQRDSIYLDSAGMGFPLVRDYTEYKWLAPDYHFPLLNVREEGLVVTVTYMDSLRSNFLGLREQDPVSAFTLSPNPATLYTDLTATLEGVEVVQVSLRDITGKELYRSMESSLDRSILRERINLGSLDLRPGIYIVVVSAGSTSTARKLIIQ